MVSTMSRRFAVLLSATCLLAVSLSIWLLVPAHPTSAAAEKKAPTDADLYQWFDGLGCASFAKRPLVRVATGHWYKADDRKRKNSFLHGFLLKADDKTFTVLKLDLSRRTYTKTAGNIPAHERVGYRVADLEDYGDEHLQSLRKPPRKTTIGRDSGGGFRSGRRSSCWPGPAMAPVTPDSRAS